MASLRKLGGNWYFRFVDEHGNKVERKGCLDRRVTLEMARAAEAETARSRAGLVDPRLELMAKEARRPISQHVAEFLDGMRAHDRDAKHVGQTESAIGRVLDLAGIGRVGDLTPSAVLRAVAVIRDEGLSARTANLHIASVKALGRWLWRDGCIPADPLAGLSLLNQATDQRHVRRALTPTPFKVKTCGIHRSIP